MSIFAGCDYWTPKVALAVYGSEPRELGLGGLQTLKTHLSAFVKHWQSANAHSGAIDRSVPSCR